VSSSLASLPLPVHDVGVSPHRDRRRFTAAFELKFLEEAARCVEPGALGSGSRADQLIEGVPLAGRSFWSTLTSSLRQCAPERGTLWPALSGRRRKSRLGEPEGPKRQGGQRHPRR